MRERQMLMDALDTATRIETDMNDNIELIEMGEMEEDQEVITDAEEALKALEITAAEKELEALLDGEADSNDTFLEINSGAGGTESCDWASMLARMYVRWAEKKKAIRSSCNPRVPAKRRGSNPPLTKYRVTMPMGG